MKSSQARTILEKRYPSAIVTVSEATSGYSTEVFYCEVNGEKLYARITTDNLFVLRQVYEVAQQAGVPVSKYYDSWHDTEYGCFVLLRHVVVGAPLNAVSDPTDRHRLLRSFGTILGNMHTIPLSGFGTLTAADELCGTYESWHGYLQAWQKPWEDLVTEKLLTDSHLDQIKNIYQKIIARTVDTPVLLHNDFHGGHLFVEGNQAAGVIDFSKAIAGDACWDIAKSLYYLDQQERKIFLAGYGRSVDYERVIDYEILIALDKTIWSHQEGLDIFPRCHKQLQTYFEV